MMRPCWPNKDKQADLRLAVTHHIIGILPTKHSAKLTVAHNSQVLFSPQLFALIPQSERFY